MQLQIVCNKKEEKAGNAGFPEEKRRQVKIESLQLIVIWRIVRR